MAKIKCPACGVEIDDNVKFCPYCGVEQKQQNTSVDKPQIVVENAPKQPTPPKKNKGAFISSIICLVIAAMFFALYAVQYFEIIYSTESDGLNFLVLIIYILTTGSFTIFPMFVLTIVSAVCSGLGFKSPSKAIKTVSVIMFVFAMILVFLFLLSLILPSIGAFKIDPDGYTNSTAFRMFM